MSNKLSRTLTFHLDEDALLQVYGREAAVVWLTNISAYPERESRLH